MKREYKHIIIGAGASGLMLASLLKEKQQILLIDAGRSVGAKISISGGGKCNLTNESVDSSNYLGERSFVSDVLGRFDQAQTLSWFAKRGVHPVVRKSGQYFCVKSADEVTALFHREIQGVDLSPNTQVKNVYKKDGKFIVETSRGTYIAEHLIVASGGLSYPRIGASGIGHDIAKSFGHTVTTLSPALVGFTLQPEQFFFKELSGVSVEVEVGIEDKSIRGSLLFAHKGISGPAILNTSLYWKKGKITIDFLPDFSWKSLRGSKKQISTLLPMPKRAAKTFLEYLKIVDKPANRLSPDDIENLKSLQEYSFAPAGTFGYSKAEVTRGGVSTDEMSSDTMMSTIEPNLYFIGEVLDVTGELGGYNFQWAFSSAYTCANALVIEV